MKNSCAIIILAGGSGRRFGATKPKQLASLEGKPLLWHSLNTFMSSSVPIDCILVVSHPQYIQETRKLVSRYFSSGNKISVIQGGKHRIHSYFKAIDALRRHNIASPIVVAHDAARPCITPRDLLALYSKFISSRQVDAQLVTRALPESLFSRQKNTSLKCKPRDAFVLGQSPNIFKSHILFKVREKNRQRERLFGESLDILQLLPVQYKIQGVSLSHPNPKVTFSEDLQFARLVLCNRKQKQRQP